VTLAELWPTDQEIQDAVSTSIDPSMYQAAYATIFDGDENWQKLAVPTGDTFEWDADSTYLRRPPFLELGSPADGDILDARALLYLGDSVTTDHICPAGRVPLDSAAGRLLRDQGVDAKDLSSYAARRGNWQIMELGGFSNKRLANRLVPEGNGGRTRDFLDPDGRIRDTPAVAADARAAGIPLVVLAGREYGTGSSRDWAAKVTRLLGIRAVIAESYERIHRSNLVGMGVLPLQFGEGVSAVGLELDGTEAFAITGFVPGGDVPSVLRVRATHPMSGRVTDFDVRARIDTALEQRYYRAGGVLPYVLARTAARERPARHLEATR